MIPRSRPWSGLIFNLAASAGPAVYITTLIQSRSYTILNHGFNLLGSNLLIIFGLWATVFAGLTLAIKIMKKKDADDFSATTEKPWKDRVTWLWPLIVLLATPILKADYFNREDFQRRLVLLGLFVVAAMIYLRWADLASRMIKRRSRDELSRQKLTCSPTQVPAYQDGDKKQGSELTPNKPRSSGRGVEELNSGQSLQPQSPSIFGRGYDLFLRLSVKKRLFILFVIAFLVYNACALILVLEGSTFSGDEPNYLITTHSLVSDGDINVANNYANRDYFHFYEEKENPRLRMIPYARAGKKGRDYIYPINLPGISALMVPYYAVSQAFEGRARTFILKGSLAIWAILLGLQIYLLALDLWKREGLALGLWALYAFSTPVLFYAIHIYPEIPIALFSIYIYRMVRSGRPLSALHLAFMGALLGTFFWFGVKYNLIFWPVLITAVFYLWSTVKPRAKLAWLVAPALIGMALFYFAVWTMYGTFSPFAVYEGVLLPGQAQAITQSFLDLPLSSRIETFLDYFLDQRDGLLFYAPFWIFMFLGIIEMFRQGKKARKDLLGLLFIAGPFVLNYAFFTHRQGFCPQARVLTPISWIGAIALGYFLERRGKRVFGWLFGVGVAAAGAVSWILLRHPNFLYQPTTHDYTTRAGDLFAYLSNIRFYLPQFLPSFIKADNSRYGPNYVWVGLAVVFIGLYLILGRRQGKPLSRRFHGVAAMIFLGGGLFLWVLPPRIPLFPSWPVRYSTGGSLGFYMMPMGRGVVAKNEGEMYLHFEKSYRFVFSSRDKVDKIKLAYGSEKGKHEIQMTFFDTPLLEARTAREIKEWVFEPKTAYHLRDLYVYEIDLTLKKINDENLLVDPYLLRISPVR